MSKMTHESMSEGDFSRIGYYQLNHGLPGLQDPQFT